jgi:hypothetical protein
MSEKPWVKSYCGGKPNYCTPVDAVNMSQDRVDETAKGEHEPLYMDMSQVPIGMPDWKPGMVFPAPKKEWVGLTDEEVGTLTVFDGLHHIETPLLADFIRATEAKIKEKNGG